MHQSQWMNSYADSAKRRDSYSIGPHIIMHKVSSIDLSKLRCAVCNF